MSDQAPPPAFTLQTSSRIVLTDVTVTDKQGNPVHGLPESAFRVYDNGKLQQIGSFVEHQDGPEDTTTPPPTVTKPNQYSNEYLRHPPKVLNILLLDTTNLRITDQMYLYVQMKKFIGQLPPGVPFAVYSQSGLYLVEQQTFTTDHALLLAAIHRAIPQLSNPDAQYSTEFSTLHQLVVHLNQLPGRKNVLWFSGGAILGLLADAGDLPPNVNLQPVYDELEASRIALYPIAARGLTVSFSFQQGYQQQGMEQSAQATGGRAIFNTNGLAKAALQVASVDGSYYTLSYAPSDLKFDNKWHKVKVAVDKPGGYQLSYRRGYYDDGANTQIPAKSKRVALGPNGEKDMVQGPDLKSQPIIFTVGVAPAGGGDAAGVSAETIGQGPKDKKGRKRSARGVPYTLTYSVPLKELDRNQTVGGDPNERLVKLGASVIAFTKDGYLVEQKVQAITLTLNEAKLEAAPDDAVPFAIGVNLPPGTDSLYAVVWDMKTHRAGSIEVPVDVAKPVKSKP